MITISCTKKLFELSSFIEEQDNENKYKVQCYVIRYQEGAFQEL